MPNRLNVPSELEVLIEKREREHRREEDRLRAAARQAELDELDRSAHARRRSAKHERRKNRGRREEDEA